MLDLVMESFKAIQEIIFHTDLIYLFGFAVFISIYFLIKSFFEVS